MWAKVDDKLFSHPKWIATTAAGKALWVSALSWCASQRVYDGRVPRRMLRVLGATVRDAESLVASGLWVRDGDDYLGSYELHRDERRSDIPAAVRAAVYERDGHACVTCGSGDDLTLDHVVPWSRGGSDAADNLQTMCRPCNSSKGATY